MKKDELLKQYNLLLTKLDDSKEIDQNIRHKLSEHFRSSRSISFKSFKSFGAYGEDKEDYTLDWLDIFFEMGRVMTTNDNIALMSEFSRRVEMLNEMEKSLTVGLRELRKLVDQKNEEAGVNEPR